MIEGDPEPLEPDETMSAPDARQGRALVSPAALDYLALVGIGGWMLEFEPDWSRLFTTEGDTVPLRSRLWWSPFTHRLHQTPAGFVPTLESALAFYPEPGRGLLREAIHRACREGEGLDLELPLVTAAGHERMVRIRARSVGRRGSTFQLYGTIEDVTQRHAELRELARLSFIVRQLSSPVLILDRQGRIEWVNAAFEDICGWTLGEIAGRSPDAFLQPTGDPSGMMAEVQEAFAAGSGFHIEAAVRRPDGGTVWLELRCSPFQEKEGSFGGFVLIGHDITARRAAEDAAFAELFRRTEVEAMLREIISAMPSGVHVCDRDERVILWNDSYLDIFPALRPVLLQGATLESLVRAGVESGSYKDPLLDTGRAADKEAFVQTLLEQIRRAGQETSEREVELADGRWIQARERRSQSGYLVCVRTDITKLKETEREAKRRAEEDPLTGLANRSLLIERIRALLNPAADQPVRGCLLVADIDHFKAINDAHGHIIGDRLLQTVAKRLAASVRRNDTVARLSGDEFAILLPTARRSPAVLDLLQRIKASAETPLALDQNLIVRPKLSIGAAFLPEDGASVSEIMTAADTALFMAKRMGRGRIVLYERAFGEEMQRRAELAEKLAKAIAERRIRVALQPQIRLSDGAVIGFEALARWHEDGRPIPPLEFVRLADERGLALDLGWAVLDAALEAHQRLRGTGWKGRIGINVATAQLVGEGAERRFLDALDQHGVSSDEVELEVTENVILDQNVEHLQGVLGVLNDAGVSFALDDFGTGYASLTHLTKLPIRRIKVDRSFVQALPDHEQRSAMVARTIIALGRELALETVAEGVENEEQMSALEALGCDAIQGYLIGKPMFCDEAVAWLRARLGQRVGAGPA